MTVESVLLNTLAAQRAVPDLGYSWGAGELRRLGERVKHLYPELGTWGPTSPLKRTFSSPRASKRSPNRYRGTRAPSGIQAFSRS